MITKENYEIWMIDQMDGNLSQADEQALMQFLDEHPELNEDCGDYDSYTLNPDEVSFTNKLNLIKTEADELEIPQADYDAIKVLEEGNSSNTPLFEQYTRTIVRADKNIIYQEKSKLKRAIVIPFVSKYTFKRFSIAASIAIILGIGFLSSNETVVDRPIAKQTDVGSVDTKSESPAIRTEKQIVLSETAVEEIATSENVVELSDSKQSVNENKRTEKLLARMSPKGIIPLQTQAVNAYEIGLNSIMPLMIKQQLTEKQFYAQLKKNEMQTESEALSRKANKMANRAKVINFLSGNETTIKKYINKEGQLIAYEVESDGGMSFIRKVKGSNETNY